ncbi:MAG: DMT family transporter [Treponema sp.]|jgi:drug/metabolite transporter (DMT)-like permease|nr:DMT family transporter [Treponema sp.]
MRKTIQLNRAALRADLLLLLTAAIWGFGFVAQRSGMEHVGPFTFNGVRFLLGCLFLLPFIIVRRKRSKVKHISLQRLLLPVLAAGSCVFIAVLIQQFGIMFTTAGNAGFITGLYVVFTPILGIFLRRKTGYATWFGSILTFIGLYFISIAGRPSINPGDIIIIISAFLWAVHVLLIDRFMNTDIKREETIDPIELSAGQFAVCGILMMLGAVLAEPHVIPAVERINPALLIDGLFEWQPFPVLVSAIGAGEISLSLDILIPILYGGLCSVGIAYTFQVVAQRNAPPAHATIILCFEGCFAAFGGMLLLSEKVGSWTLLGFALMLTGMLATQWEVIRGAKKVTG